MKKRGADHIVYSFDNLYDGVRKQAERYGEKARYVYKVNKEEKTFTFNDMKRHVDYIAAALEKLGLAGKFAGVTGDTHPDYIASYIAVASCGGVIVPLDKDILNEQFVGFCDMCDIEIIF